MSAVDVFALVVTVFSVACWIGVIVYGYRGQTLKHGIQVTLLMAAYEVATLLVVALVLVVVALIV